MLSNDFFSVSGKSTIQFLDHYIFNLYEVTYKIFFCFHENSVLNHSHSKYFCINIWLLSRNILILGKYNGQVSSYYYWDTVHHRPVANVLHVHIVHTPLFCCILYAQHDRVRTTIKKKVHPKFFQNPFLGCLWVVWLGIRTWSAIGPYKEKNNLSFFHSKDM